MNTNKYTGKMFDAMIQVNSEEEVQQVLDNSEVDKFCIFYRNEFIKDISSDRVLLGTTKRKDQRNDITLEYLNEILNEIRRYDSKFIGELMLSHADKHSGDSHENYERYINAESPILSALISGVEVPIMFHWEVYNTERDLVSIENMLKNNPSKTFIWPHCGFADPKLVDYLLSNHSNLVATLSKLELIRTHDDWILHSGEDLGGYNVVNKEYLKRLDTGMLDKKGRIKLKWQRLLQKHQTRFMFASDCHKSHRFDKYNTIVSIWRDILGNFDNNIAEKIAYSNAMRVYQVQ
jgi:hypothetical protein